MSKIIFISDIHLGVRNASKEWLDIHSDYFYNFFIPTVKNLNNDRYLIIAGDVFDNRQTLNLLTLDFALKLFNDLSSLFKEIYIIVGNHDVFLKSSNQISSLDTIKYLSSNIKVYKEPEIVTIEKLNFLLLPWIFDKVKESEIIKTQSKFSDYLVCHTEVSGFYFNTKIQVKDGNDLSIYKDYKKVFSGHFHMRQNNKNLYYLGSPLHFNRNDIDDKKGIYILDSQTEDLQFIENNHSPEFKKYKIIDLLDLKLEDFKKESNNNFIYITADDLFISKYNINSLLNELKDVRDIKINIIETERKINEIVTTENKKFNVIDLCKKYMQDNNTNKDEEDKIISYIEKIYNKVS